MKNYKLVGLTGTTGAGKGAVRSLFEENGFSAIDADLLARKALEDQLVLNNIISFFGKDVVTDGVLNRKLLASRAFSSKENTKLLNDITHPYITSLFLKNLKDLIKSGKDKIIFDAPQLFESNLNFMCDIIISVTACENVRTERIIKRDRISEELAKKRICVQYSDKFFTENSDYIIENNSTLDELKEKVYLLIDKI